MKEPGFFPQPEPISVAEIAALTGAEVRTGANLDRMISGITPLDRAGPADAVFFDSRRYIDALAATRAGACFCVAKDVDLVPPGTVALATREPHRAFALLAARLFPRALKPQAATGISGISGKAHIDASARIEAGVTIEPGAVIGPGVEIGAGCLVGPGAVVAAGVRVGRESVVAANVTIAHALIGNRVVIHSGARIGQDGFGHVPGASGHTKIVQIGRVIIQDDVEIGANTTIDRGSNRDTIIGEGTKIDNLVQIGHNVVIGRHCLIAGQVGISGSVTIGDFVMLGGNAGLRDNLTIGNGARVAAAAAVHSNIPAGETWAGYPAQPMQKWLREMRVLKRVLTRFAKGGIGEGAAKDKDGPDGH